MALTSIGDMMDVVKFEKNTPTDTDSGGQLDVWVEFLTTRGRLRKNSGNRTLEAGEQLFNSGYELITRFQSALEFELESSGNVRMVIGNRFFTIDSWYDFEQKGRWYQMNLSEQHI